MGITQEKENFLTKNNINYLLYNNILWNNDIFSLCLKNAEIALEQGCRDTAKFWHLIGYSLKDLNKNIPRLKEWKNAPNGKPLFDRLLKKFEEQHDIQNIAMLLYIVLRFEIQISKELDNIKKNNSIEMDNILNLFHPQNTNSLPKSFDLFDYTKDETNFLHRNFKTRIHNRLKIDSERWKISNSPSHEVGFSMLLSDTAKLITKYYMYLKTYERMLFSWMLYPQYLEFAFLCHTIRQYKSNFNLLEPYRVYSILRPEDTGHIDDFDHLIEKGFSIIPFQNCSDKWHKLCSVCNLSASGVRLVCPRCGHGGHAEHLHSWFSKHDLCATGCGCCCLKSILL